MPLDPLAQIIVILHQPRDVVNIGGVVRAMKNMGLQRLRLVDPAPFDPVDISGIAHRSQDILDSMQIYANLDSALVDISYLVGTTARPRASHPVHDNLRILAPDLLARATDTPLALLFGPEDNGLDNSALDRCNIVLTLAVDPTYASLNLAQAVLLFLYELRMAKPAVPVQRPSLPPPAGVEQLQQLIAVCEQALHTVEFFKNGQSEGIMRTLRTLIYRSAPDQREAALLTAMAREVVAYVRRRG